MDYFYILARLTVSKARSVEVAMIGYRSRSYIRRGINRNTVHVKKGQ